MGETRRTWIGIALIAAAALAVVALPGGGVLAALVGNSIQAAFLALAAFGMTRLYRTRSDWLAQLPNRDRAVLYAAGAVAVLAIVAFGRFRELGGGGTVLLIAILGVCGAAAYWVWRESQRWTI